MEQDQKEIKEVDHQARKVVLHFVRHGETSYSNRNDVEGCLTDKGREQARKAAEEIYQQLPEGAVVAFISSDRKRAKQTTEVIGEKITSLEQSQNKRLFLYNQGVKTIERLGISNEAAQEYLSLIAQKENPTAYWLENPGKTADEIQRNFGSLLRHFTRFANHLGSTGPEIHVVLVTHNPVEVFVGKLLGVAKVEPLGNCEQFVLELPVSQRKAVLNYKDQRKEVIV